MAAKGEGRSVIGPTERRNLLATLERYDQLVRSITRVARAWDARLPRNDYLRPTLPETFLAAATQLHIAVTTTRRNLLALQRAKGRPLTKTEGGELPPLGC